MSEMKALPFGSQSGPDLLYLDTSADPKDIWECATFRLDAAQQLVDYLAVQSAEGSQDGTAAVSNALAILLSDSRGLFDELHESIKRYQAKEKEAEEKGWQQAAIRATIHLLRSPSKGGEV